MFDAKKVKNEIVEWMTAWFEKNGNGCNAVVGVSGGKDSSVVRHYVLPLWVRTG